MPEFEVSVLNTFEAASPEHAVRLMVDWLAQEAQNAAYRVLDLLRNESFLIDAGDLQ